jgi:hypothetical protein
MSTLTAHDIAHLWLETDRRITDCDGTRLDDHTRVWCDLHMDLDYQQAYLLRVWTNVGRGTMLDGERLDVTVTDHLLVFERAFKSRVEVQWREKPRLFFEADADWTYEGNIWFINQMESIREMDADEFRRGRSPEDLASLKAHNRKVEDKDRWRAEKLGLHHLLVPREEE